MPNEVVNRLSVLGPPEEVLRFSLLSRRPGPKTGDRLAKDDREDREPEPDSVIFGFDGVVPLPPEYAVTPYRVRGGRGGYDMEFETWGVKWGPYDFEPSDIQSDEGRFTAQFVTAWDAPRTYLFAASKKFPDCIFGLSCCEEQGFRGRLAFCRGEKHISLAIMERCPACTTSECYVRSHDAWLTSLSETLGFVTASAGGGQDRPLPANGG